MVTLVMKQLVTFDPGNKVAGIAGDLVLMELLMDI